MHEEPTRPQGEDPIPEKVYQLADHLWQNPDDLIDASHLLQRFDVSVEEFQQALALLDV